MSPHHFHRQAGLNKYIPANYRKIVLFSTVGSVEWSRTCNALDDLRHIGRDANTDSGMDFRSWNAARGECTKFAGLQSRPGVAQAAPQQMEHAADRRYLHRQRRSHLAVEPPVRRAAG